MSADRAIVSIVKGHIEETPISYSQKDLKTVREMITKSMDLIGGLQNIIGNARTVVVKPNLVEVPFETTGGSVVTDPRILESLVGLLKEHGVQRVLVAEGRSDGGSVRAAGGSHATLGGPRIRVRRGAQGNPLGRGEGRAGELALQG